MNKIDLLIKDEKNIDIKSSNNNSSPNLVISNDNNIKGNNNKALDLGLDLLMNNDKADSISVKSIDSATLGLPDDNKSDKSSISGVTSINLDTLKPRDDISDAPSINLDFNNKPRQKHMDDFGDSNSIPKVPESSNVMTDKERREKKRDLLFKYERLKQNNDLAYKDLSMNDSYDDIKHEVDKLTHTRKIKSSVKFQRKVLMAVVTGVEFLNNKFDPFDVHLDGWSENVHESIDDYDEVFEELYEKYKGSGEMAPEIKLLFTLAGSGFMFHLSKTLFKSSLPGMQDIMQDNPDLMKQFMSAAVKGMTNNMNNGGGNTMGGGMRGGGGNRNTSGGGGGMLGGLMGGLGSMFGGGGGGGSGRKPNNNTMGNLGNMMRERQNEGGSPGESDMRQDMNDPDTNDIDQILMELKNSEKKDTIKLEM